MNDIIAYAYKFPWKRPGKWPVRKLFAFNFAKRCVDKMPIEECRVKCEAAWQEEKTARRTVKTKAYRQAEAEVAEWERTAKLNHPALQRPAGDASSRQTFLTPPARKRNRLCDDDSFSGQD